MEQSSIAAPTAVNGALKPLALTLGLASPMWMAYGAAASVGATWWWMSRMGRFVAPLAAPVVLAEPAETILDAPLEAIEQTVSAVAETAPDPLVERPDELTLIRGVGPRVADALVARGVTTFAQLAAWSEHDMAHFDKALKLLGRSARYDFLGQARALAGA